MSEMSSCPQIPRGQSGGETADIAVLITVYHKIAESHLQAALRSVAEQTITPRQLIVVADGPLPSALNSTLQHWTQHYDELPTEFIVHRLEFNSGSGPAAHAGLQRVDATWLARLDADDIALPQRLEQQLSYATQHCLDVVGTALAEFDAVAVENGAAPEDAVLGIRRLPESHEEILRYARWNSPVNNPSAMMRTDLVRTVGGYREIPGMEDYDLWVRLLSAGARFGNMQKPLTLFRAGPSMLRRRKDSSVIRYEWQMQTTLMDHGLIGRPRTILNVVLRVVFRLLPLPVLRILYTLLFHRRGAATTLVG